MAHSMCVCVCVRRPVCVFNTWSGDSLLDHAASFWLQGRTSDTKQSDGFDGDASWKWLFDVMFGRLQGCPTDAEAASLEGVWPAGVWTQLAVLESLKARGKDPNKAKRRRRRRVLATWVKEDTLGSNTFK